MGNTEQAKKIYQQFKDHLTQHDFHFDAHDDELIISMTVHGEDLPQPTLIRVLADRDMVQVLSPIPSRIPEDKRIDGAIAVSIANYGMINGCFDYDMNDGEVRFRVAQSYRGIEFSDALVGYLLQVTFFTTDKYNDRFFMLGKGLMSIEQFIQKEQEG